jgi:Tfp pilus assembly protein PilV
MKTNLRKKKLGTEAGMTLIELALAGFILTVGMMGSLVLIFIAIQSNGRNKIDTTGTMIAQMVIEQINVMPTNSGVETIPIKDCVTTAHPTATTWTIEVNGNATPSTAPNGGIGAQLSNGVIDFTQAQTAVPANYGMLYHTCGDSTYDVRWNVQQLTTLTRVVIVSARLQNAAGTIAQYSPPVTLRTINGP